VRQVKAAYGLERVVDFSASINPLGHPEGLKEHLLAHWEQVLVYPDRDSSALRAAVSSHFGIGTDSVVPGNGSAELIDIALRAFKPDRVVLCPPDFGLYESLAPEGTPVVRVPRVEARGFAPDLGALAGKVRGGDLVLFSNPGNPSGFGVSPIDFSPLLDRCAHVGATLALDEAFADFCPEVSSLPQRPGHPSLVVLRSLTKFFGIPGLRLGFLVAPPVRVRQVADLQVPWSVNGLAQEAGVYCLAQSNWGTRTRAYVAAARERLSTGISGIAGLRPLASRANYLLVEISPPAPSASRLYQALLGSGILVRHCGSFGLGERYVRLAVRTDEENESLVAALRLPVRPDGPEPVSGGQYR
jgi:threonine-phosphate decarboxylase